MINTQLSEDIEGEAYSTFAEAAQYCEEHKDNFFQIELPAGEFNEKVGWFEVYAHPSRVVNYTIHGNHTILNGNIETYDKIRNIIDYNKYELRDYSISDCVINGRLINYGEVKHIPMPIYYFENCVINDLRLLNEAEGEAEVIAYDCVINTSTTDSENGYGVDLNAYNCNILKCRGI